MGVSEQSRSESIEMVWACGKNGEYRIARRVLMAEVTRGRVRGRPRLGWMDSLKVALDNRGMTVEATRQCAKDGIEWRALVHILTE